jgi:hypothetical protein
MPNTIPILAPRVSAQDLNSIKEDTRRAVVRKDFQTFTESDGLPKWHMPEFRENVPHANARQAKRFAGRQEECALRNAVRIFLRSSAS